MVWLERAWGEAVTKPLAPVSLGWDLVTQARDELILEAPLSWQEAKSDPELSVHDVLREEKVWRTAREERDEQVEGEVWKEIGSQ